MTKPISLTQQTYDALREVIVTGQLPPGAPVNIREMAAKMGVSSGAVREALSRLSAERLVVSEQRGFIVSPITIAEVEDLGRTRAEVEGHALRRAIEIGDDAWEAGVRAALERLKAAPPVAEGSMSRVDDEFVKAYESFHYSLTAACDRVWLLRVQEWLAAQAHRTRFLVISAPHYDRTGMEEALEALMNAALDRDADLAVKLLYEYIMAATQRLLQALAPAVGLLGRQSPGQIMRLTPAPAALKNNASASRGKKRAKR